MSYIAPLGEQSTSAEIQALTNLTNLEGGTGLYIRKTGTTTFENAAEAGTGSVTMVSVVSANGLAGTVATDTTTPTITLTTTITGLLKGNGTAISAASDGTDYLSPTTGLKLDQTSAQTITNDSPIFDTLTASELVATTAAKKLQSLAVATYPSLTELSYVKGLSSAIQDQINGKAASDQTMYIGTTAVDIDRTSATLNLTGIGTLGCGAITSSGTLALGANDITMSGSIGVTGTRVTKLWATDIEITNLPTINGGTLVASLPTADTSTTGLLTDTDWDTFNGKLSSLAFAGLTDYPANAVGALANDGSGNLSWVATGVGDMVLASAQSVTGAKTFDKGKLLVKGTSTGTTDLTTANTSGTSYTATFPAKTGTVAMTSDIPAAGASTALDNLASVAINTSLIPGADVSVNMGTGDLRYKDMWIETISSGLTASDTLKLRGRDIDGTAYVDILTITSANTVTADLNAITTIGGNAILYSGGSLGTPSAGTLTNCTFPTLNQNTTGSAATLTTARAIYGNNFDGSAALTQVIGSTYGGTGNGFTKFTGATTAEKTYTLPDSSVTLLYSGGALGTPSGGTLTNCGGLPLTGLVDDTTTALGVGTIELGHASDTTLSRTGAGAIAVEGVAIPTISSTSTLTNKRITKRVVTTTDDATAVIDVDTTDVYELSAIANATTFTLTGTPTDGQTLMIRFKDAGTTKGLTFTGFTVIGVTLPTDTTAGKWHYVGCQYNLAATAWHVLAVGEEA